MGIISNSGSSKELVTTIRGSGTYIVPADTTANITPVAYGADLTIEEPLGSAQVVFPQLESSFAVSNTAGNQYLTLTGLKSANVTGYNARLFFTQYVQFDGTNGTTIEVLNDAGHVVYSFTTPWEPGPTFRGLVPEGVVWLSGYTARQLSGGTSNPGAFQTRATVAPANITPQTFSAIAGSTVVGDEFIVEEYA